MVFEQRPSTPPQGPLGRHPDLQQFLGDRQMFPLTAWLRSNSPKMARIAACQQFRAHLSDNIALRPGDNTDGYEDQGVLGDVEDSEHSADERSGGAPGHDDKENQATPSSRKSKRGKLSRLRRLLRMKQRCPV
ncbi:hypothetical protein ONE63_006887 [Megalurothrips usitatus]|uniref:Uncharacterized protein n=1 Tax=Megalurothrips usitatus TaxID=439358 RepID=A0AAV7XR43_9NEOP|nr:hypothetical protein ONE63_006887 [Megalurothrips usitatus]